MAVGLLLGSRGEAPREVKFQGALLAQNEVAPGASNQPAIDELSRNKPSFTPAVVLYVVGGASVLVGGVLFFVGLANLGTLGGLVSLIAGIVLVPVGVVLIVVAIVVTIGIGVARAGNESRQRKLEAPVESTLILRPQGGLVLARF